MKINDKKELQEKSKEGLVKLLQEAQVAFSQLRLDHVQNKLKNTRDLFNKRKEIAIMKTILTMKLKIKEGER